MEMGLKKRVHRISPGRESEDVLGGGISVNKDTKANIRRTWRTQANIRRTWRT